MQAPPPRIPPETVYYFDGPPVTPEMQKLFYREGQGEVIGVVAINSNLLVQYKSGKRVKWSVEPEKKPAKPDITIGVIGIGLLLFCIVTLIKLAIREFPDFWAFLGF